MEFYFLSKQELSTCAGFDGRIPWTAIHEYAVAYAMTHDEFHRLLTHIRTMESVLRGEADKDKASTADKGAGDRDDGDEKRGVPRKRGELRRENAAGQ